MAVEDRVHDAPAQADGRRSPVALLVVLVLAVAGPIVPDLTAQPASRYALTAALVDRHTVDVGGYPLGVDFARFEGRLRSDKAPGQPVIAAPFYAAYRAVGGEPATHRRAHGNLGVWWVTLWSSAIPLAVLAALVYRACATVAPDHALLSATAVVFGSLLLPFGGQPFGHVVAATLAFGAWGLACRPRPDRRALVLAGFLLGAAIATEYPTVIVAVAVGAAVWVRERGRALWLAVGAAAPLAALAVYHSIAFGAPFRVPTQYYAGRPYGLDPSTGGYSLPTFGDLFEALAGGRGLLMVSPILVAGLGAALLLAGRPGPARRDACVGAGVAAGYLLLVAGWSGSDILEDPGPRYLIPMIPFLAVPLACLWPRLPKLFGVLALWGGAVMGTALVVPFLVRAGDPVLNALVQRLADGELNPTIWTIAFGRPAGWALHLTTVALAVFALRKWRHLDEAGRLASAGAISARTGRDGD